eukprot:4293266-Amphidinium_carterae.1
MPHAARFPESSSSLCHCDDSVVWHISSYTMNNGAANREAARQVQSKVIAVMLVLTPLLNSGTLGFGKLCEAPTHSSKQVNYDTQRIGARFAHHQECQLLV